MSLVSSRGTISLSYLTLRNYKVLLDVPKLKVPVGRYIFVKSCLFSVLPVVLLSIVSFRLAQGCILNIPLPFTRGFRTLFPFLWMQVSCFSSSWNVIAACPLPSVCKVWDVILAYTHCNSFFWRYNVLLLGFVIILSVCSVSSFAVLYFFHLFFAVWILVHVFSFSSSGMLPLTSVLCESNLELFIRHSFVLFGLIQSFVIASYIYIISIVTVFLVQKCFFHYVLLASLFTCFHCFSFRFFCFVLASVFLCVFFYTFLWCPSIQITLWVLYMYLFSEYCTSLSADLYHVVPTLFWPFCIMSPFCVSMDLVYIFPMLSIGVSRGFLQLS